MPRAGGYRTRRGVVDGAAAKGAPADEAVRRGSGRRVAGKGGLAPAANELSGARQRTPPHAGEPREFAAQPTVVARRLETRHLDAGVVATTEMKRAHANLIEGPCLRPVNFGRHEGCGAGRITGVEAEVLAASTA